MTKKILIADDEPDMVRMLANRLKANNYEVVAALDGMQALSAARREQPDLIILDVRMPARDGYSVLEALRLSAQTTLIPIVFLSALPASQVQERATELGAEGHFSKPFDSDEIVAKIREIIGD
jgi:DNA-binding response OmpR family regulator